MKFVTLAAAAVAATALSASAAAAQDANWYVRGDIGGNFNSRIDGSPSVKGDNGWALSGAVGREVMDGVRVEEEITYLQSDGKNGSSGKLETTAGLVNAYYDFNRQGAWRPFVGAGLGVGQVKIDGGPNSGDDTGFAYQFKVGLAHPINDRLTAEVAYRYLGVTGVRLGAAPGGIHGDYTDQAATVGLRYKFGL
ncbi:outer membrane protein [Phenylobacterium hankyongense]|nr:outer membrane beta-barrel protein [Phenylobacterium hankyongense]